MTRHVSEAPHARHNNRPTSAFAGNPPPQPAPAPVGRHYRYRPGPYPGQRPAPRPPLPDTLQARARRTGRHENPAIQRAHDGDKLPYMALSRTTEEVLRILLDGDLSRLRAEGVAEQLGISCTTLRRRLRDDHTSYQFLLDRARQYRSEQLLRESWLPGKCLADQLGYVEVNSFYRAFRRWTGMSFSAYKRHRER